MSKLRPQGAAWTYERHDDATAVDARVMQTVDGAFVARVSISRFDGFAVAEENRHYSRHTTALAAQGAAERWIEVFDGAAAR